MTPRGRVTGAGRPLHTMPVSDAPRAPLPAQRGAAQVPCCRCGCRTTSAHSGRDGRPLEQAPRAADAVARNVVKGILGSGPGTLVTDQTGSMRGLDQAPGVVAPGRGRSAPIRVDRGGPIVDSPEHGDAADRAPAPRHGRRAAPHLPYRGPARARAHGHHPVGARRPAQLDGQPARALPALPRARRPPHPRPGPGGHVRPAAHRGLAGHRRRPLAGWAADAQHVGPPAEPHSRRRHPLWLDQVLWRGVLPEPGEHVPAGGAGALALAGDLPHRLHRRAPEPGRAAAPRGRHRSRVPAAHAQPGVRLRALCAPLPAHLPGLGGGGRAQGHRLGRRAATGRPRRGPRRSGPHARADRDRR